MKSMTSARIGTFLYACTITTYDIARVLSLVGHGLRTIVNTMTQ